MGTEAAILRLQHAAEVLEAELRRDQLSQPLLFKRAHELQSELTRYLRQKQAMEACGVTSEAYFTASDLVRECHVMIECVSLILYQ